ncbi:MAG: hypothetical protein AAGM38_18985 [Pseudomonadota bacterium]
MTFKPTAALVALTLLTGVSAGCGAAAPWSAFETDAARGEAPPGAAPSDASIAQSDLYLGRAAERSRLTRGATPFAIGGAYGRLFGAEPAPSAAR